MKVGDYVRIKYGNIGKITNLNKQFSQVEYQDNQTRCDTNESNILKSSPDIIDLIEVGDYVNGYKVDEIDEKGIYNYNSYDGWRVNIASCNEDIESIVTKEQFSQSEYRIGE